MPYSNTYDVPESDYANHMMNTYNQIMNLPSSVLSNYFSSLGTGGGVPMTSILQQPMVNFPQENDPNYRGGLGYGGVNNSSSGRTVTDVIRDMGGTYQPTNPVENQWEQPTHQFVDPNAGKGNTGLNGQGSNSGFNLPQYNQGDYPFMFDMEMLRKLTQELLGGVRGLTPQKATPFEFSKEQSPNVGDTMGLINNLVQRYRGL